MPKRSKKLISPLKMMGLAVPTLCFVLVACATGPSSADVAAGDEASGAENALSSTSSSKLTPAAGPGMCLQPKNKNLTNGTPIVLAKCDGSNEQAWVLTGSTVRVSGTHCIDVTDGNNKDGTRLQLWDCAQNNTNQKWTENNKALGWMNTNKCIDMTDGNNAEGTVVQVWTCNGGPNQQWTSTAQGSQVGSGAPADAGSGIAVGGGASVGSGNAPSGNGFASGYVHTQGSNVLDGSNNPIKLRGTNVGGWLVTENWMCGIADDSDNNGSSSGNSHMRFARDTLERRFGEAKALELMNVWYDNFMTSGDLDNIRNIGMNVIRVPFGWRNLQRADGSWVTDGSGNIDFSRLDWIVNEAGKRNIYVILDFHVWRYQRQNYWTISRNEGGSKAEQMGAAAIWTEVAKHFKNNTTVAAYDLINEAEGSPNNQLFRTLYDAVRAQDDKHMIVVESVHNNPRDLGWNNVMYDVHLYSMMGQDYGANQRAWNAFVNGTIKEYKSYDMPVYVGEFMAQDNNPTLAYLLGQLNSNNLHWTNWAYKTVNMGSWGLYNLGGNARVNVLTDSADSIKNTWSNMGAANPETPLINAAKAALGR